MRIDDTRGPNMGGPEGPGGSRPTGNIGHFSGRIGRPGSSRLPAEPFSSSTPQNPLRNRTPLYASMIETATFDTASVQEMECVHDWLLGSDAHVDRYVDGVLMTNMLKQVLSGTQR